MSQAKQNIAVVNCALQSAAGEERFVQCLVTELPFLISGQKTQPVTIPSAIRVVMGNVTLVLVRSSTPGSPLRFQSTCVPRLIVSLPPSCLKPRCQRKDY